MKYQGDTISAISTPIGIGGISVIRVSGEKSIQVVDQVFQAKKSLEEYPSHKAVFGRIVDDKQLIDEVVVTVFIAPHSYTGENVVEISCHGSTFVTNKILEILLRKTRLAEPGEFTQRAFLNEKIGLTQAEAVGDLLSSQTRIAHLAAVQQYEGSLRRRIEKLLNKITEYRTLLELEIDFMEQGLDQIDTDDLLEKIKILQSDIEKLARTGAEGMIIKEGLKVSLVGAPNVGKSSIFNAFLQNERAIVTPHPGTTRDYLEEAVSLNGYLVRFFDTAGIRKTENQIEQLGIDRSYEIIKQSHKILFIIDGEENETEYQKLAELVPKENIIKVINKTDLIDKNELSKFIESDYIPCSAISDDGLEKLKEILLNDIQISQAELQSGILTNTRQIAAVQRANESIRKAVSSLQNELGYEFTAFDLKEASTALEEIIGKITTDDILNQIFENFCVGK
ncbi:MAG: tRNA uridine-5-carboxymethylaminomethyl(34) synthesis GTPase MnmE [Candidatus Cloacimonetes bacterium]|nr:tRNA uridine-5-carboxymethylaminomethyl(34) synthesis GTPase MnmE [Candidatus Cloacimonadota bacterium]MCF7813963.1 tRNA uridine-5-carboxymethylaminomethyl(34) synthesis GTPase MnmE [Candidatus Cloacimonadota bacterium]MCF7868807.1 tRNA uridine-5-carboxymethylaminomethyl(34) synthesis GTPase MnmE [Candidatus Cloacimonadota bacterium]MCF7884066.1 tRNA uridine-5-carboxymethylaminomethyl(34) synthesis GTPase MnmE [Candidatus Cloacimonadota bacterium]